MLELVRRPVPSRFLRLFKNVPNDRNIFSYRVLCFILDLIRHILLVQELALPYGNGIGRVENFIESHVDPHVTPLVRE